MIYDWQIHPDVLSILGVSILSQLTNHAPAPCFEWRRQICAIAQ